MIRLLVKMAQYLDKRFPEKRVVTAADYAELWRRINAQDCELTELRVASEIAKSGIEVLVSRIGSLESAAVHKGAVQDLVAFTAKLRDEMASLKTGLGMNRVGDSDIRAMLNGEALGENE